METYLYNWRFHGETRNWSWNFQESCTSKSTQVKPDIVIVHSGTNDLTKDVNTMSRVRKVVASVREIDTEGKIKLGFTSIVARGDINKEENNC